jgi:hypothetical protein
MATPELRLQVIVHNVVLLWYTTRLFTPMIKLLRQRIAIQCNNLLRQRLVPIVQQLQLPLIQRLPALHKMQRAFSIILVLLAVPVVLVPRVLAHLVAVHWHTTRLTTTKLSLVIGLAQVFL